MYSPRISPALHQLLVVCFVSSFAPALLQAQESAKREVAATPAERVTSLPGFKVELLYSIPKDKFGSWINLTVDSRGRLITSSQSGPLYRVTPPPVGETLSPDQIETIDVELGGAHGLLYAFDSLYVVRNEKRPAGLYRVFDSDNDDRFDSMQLLRELNGRGEHGPHSVILGPDGLYVIGGNHTYLPDVESSVVPPVWDEDLLLPRLWDANGHARGRLAPGGWIARTDPMGKRWELVSVGYRNAFDIAFNKEGDLFTFDADMEWDIGTPWYRPTRINHAMSGSDFGWRSGTGKWPEYYPDSLGSVVDIGPGSPTGIAFGYGTKFPEKYQRALFVCDWSFGKMYAVHMTPDGGTWKGTAEHFLSATPLPFTDVVVNPRDGALYFTVGGRGAQSGLYRVTYPGAPAAIGLPLARTEESVLRRSLEAYHGRQDAQAVTTAWPHLSHPDRTVRHAARVAIEFQPLHTWIDRALAEENPTAAFQALCAAARHGNRSLQSRILSALERFDWATLTEQQQLSLLRVYGLTFARSGHPAAEPRIKIVEALRPHYPGNSYNLNRELSALLIYLEDEQVAEKTLQLLADAPTQEEQLHYALALSSFRGPWSLDQRREYFQWFQGAGGYRGGHSFLGFVRNVRTEAARLLDEQTKRSLGDLLQDKPAELLAELPQPKGPGQAWTVPQLLALTNKGLRGRDFENGRRMFAAGQCFNCHRFSNRGGSTGPDLSSIAGRFNRQDLLEAIVEPSKVISDQYRATNFILADGRVVTGRVVNFGGGTFMVNSNMLDPDQSVRISPSDVVESSPSEVSMMPEQLLNRLNQDEVLDLLAYLLSRGEPNNQMFR